MTARLILGDCADVLAQLEPASVDAIVTDPPAGIGFMNRSWDRDRGGRLAWIEWLAGIMRLAYAALKPGGHALVWALPRTSHWTATAIEEAGFEIRDVHHHIFGTGFPKSADVSKAIDAHLGARREVIGANPNARPSDGQQFGSMGVKSHPPITAPGSPESARWSGFGSALKPSVEHYILARKPLIGTIAANVLKHGTGALNIDGCRIGTTHALPGRTAGPIRARTTIGYGGPGANATSVYDPNIGRWPAHLSLDHSADCIPIGVARDKHAVRSGPGLEVDSRLLAFGMRKQTTTTTTTTTTTYRCVVGCPARVLDEQSGTLASGTKIGGAYKRGAGIHDGGQRSDGAACYADSGGASRFFATFRYVAKASRSERTHHGAVANDHPTVKSIALMRWLVRLVTPPGGLVLDMFAGSGSTGLACADEGMRFLGIEQDPKYHAIALARLRLAFWDVDERPLDGDAWGYPVEPDSPGDCLFGY